MNEIADWEAAWARELSAALADLRERLEQAGRSSDDAAPAPATDAPPTPMPAPLEELGRRLGLSLFEQRVLLLAAAVELDTRIAGLCGRAQGDPRKNHPTFALAFTLFPNAAWDALSPERPLRFWRLIEPQLSGSQPIIAAPLKADERMVHYLKGLNQLDERISSWVNTLPAPADLKLAPSQIAVANSAIQAWRATAAQPQLPVVQLLGRDRSSKLRVAAHIASQLGRSLHSVEAGALPTAPADLDLLARLWHRESLLLPVALFIDADDLEPSSDRMGALRRFLGRSDGLFLIGTREVLARLDRDGPSAEARKPTAAEQREAWKELLDDDSDLASRLASQFSFNLPELERVCSAAHALSADQASFDAEVWQSCRRAATGGLNVLAQRLDPRATWDDLVLPAASERLLRQISAQVRHRSRVYDDWGFGRRMNRGLGISALFSGESGTGKTMAAEVLANDLQLDLYRIDLSAVVNKYIGETEKNLRRLFDAAEDSGAILFFDEADALFGRRSEVKDSHDRYANIEINYLLQRLESYRGLAILATNFKSALDGAFLRRLRFLVSFPFPGVEERQRLWKKAFPAADPPAGRPGAPTQGLDFGRLARFDLTGGHIHNIAVNAAFRAAAAESAITMPIVFDSVRDEFAKLERPVNPADFQWIERNGALKPAAAVASAS